MTDPFDDPNAAGAGATRDPPATYSTTFSGGCVRTSRSTSASM